MKPASDTAYVSRTIRKCLRSLQQSSSGASQRNIVALHDLRVGSRRLANSLTLFKDYFPERKCFQIRGRIVRLARLTGAARDLDVQIRILAEARRLFSLPAQRRELGVLQRMLERQRQESQQPLVEAVRQLVERTKTLEAIHRLLDTERMRSIAPSEEQFRHRAQQSMRRRLRKFLERSQCVYHPERREELHRLRIATKRLRYTLEVFNVLYGRTLTPFIRGLRGLQRHLGHLHDYDVWIETLPMVLPRHIKERAPNPMMQPLQEFYGKKRLAVYRRFRKSWEMKKQQEFWDRLRKVMGHGTR